MVICIENRVEHMEIALGAFLDIEGENMIEPAASAASKTWSQTHYM
jgi:hypothetical protein